MKEKSFSGGIITIYDLAPQAVRLINLSSGEYLCAGGGQESSPISLSESPYNWVIYDNDDSTVSLLSLSTGFAMAAVKEKSSPNCSLQLADALGNDDQKWKYLESDDPYRILCLDGKALTCENNTVCLSDYSGSDKQLWIVEKVQ